MFTINVKVEKELENEPYSKGFYRKWFTQKSKYNSARWIWKAVLGWHDCKTFRPVQAPHLTSCARCETNGAIIQYLFITMGNWILHWMSILAQKGWETEACYHSQGGASWKRHQLIEFPPVVYRLITRCKIGPKCWHLQRVSQNLLKFNFLASVMN